MSQTLKDLCQQVRMTTSPRHDRDFPGWMPGTRHYSVTIRYQGRRFTTVYHMGPGCQGDPQVEEVMDCLLSDAQAGETPTLGEFCREFGYQDKVDECLKTYRAYQRTTQAMGRVLGDDYESFSSAERG